MLTQTVHLELAGDMSTDSFILALRRFKSRRGHPEIFQLITEVTLLVPKENSKILYPNLIENYNHK